MENVIVTIARQYGSGGKTIGEMYAKDQGINCYSRETAGSMRCCSIRRMSA